MNALIKPAQVLRGTITVLADKAICHRAALLCALIDGTTEITPWSSADDCARTLQVLCQLGVRAQHVGEGIRLRGVGLTGLRAASRALDCGESGTTIRLLCGLLAGQPFQSWLTAGPALRGRPMRRVADPLTQMGARVEGRAGRGQRRHELYPPLIVQGRRPLRGLTYALPVASAQVKSALLLAGLYGDRPTTIREPRPTRDHTERLLARLGVSIQRRGHAITLTPPRIALTAPRRLVVPGDFSSAAFFIVAAAIVPGSRLVLRRVSLNPTRTKLLDVLRRMGASIQVTQEGSGWEPMGTLTIAHRPLHGIAISANDVPALIDELPILMVAACAARGTTAFHGLQELRVKETDRVHSMTTGLRRLGAGVRLQGSSGVCISASRLRGGVVDSLGDHRTAMSLAIAALTADGATRIRDAGCVTKSFGTFFHTLASVTGAGSRAIRGQG